MMQVRDLDLHRRVHILVGVGPVVSEKAAEFMRTHVTGVAIPDEVIERLRRVPKGDKRREGVRLCVELIHQIREIEEVAGVHIMAYRREDMVAEIVEEAGISPAKRKKSLSLQAHE
jgi:methylenetetrahydrofolate reductase (NADPH)